VLEKEAALARKAQEQEDESAAHVHNSTKTQTAAKEKAPDASRYPSELKQYLQQRLDESDKEHAGWSDDEKKE
jgi:hypothetical protein